MTRFTKCSVILSLLIAIAAVLPVWGGSDPPYVTLTSDPIPLGFEAGTDLYSPAAANDVVDVIKPGDSKTFKATYSFDLLDLVRIETVRGATDLPSFFTVRVDAVGVTGIEVEISYTITVANGAPEGTYDATIVWDFLDVAETVVTSRDLALEIEVNEADVFMTLKQGQLKTALVQYSFDSGTASKIWAVRIITTLPEFITFGFNAGDFVGSTKVSIQYRVTASRDAPGGVFKGVVLWEFLDFWGDFVVSRDMKMQITVDAPLPPDDHGDSCDTATDIGLGDTKDGFLDAGGDKDFFRIVITDSGTLTASTSGATNTVGTLHSDTCTSLVYEDGGGTGENFQITELLEPGTYFVSVKHFNPNESGSYTLHVQFQVTDAYKYELYFSHFGNGGGLSSQLNLLSLTSTTDTNALILIKDDEGQPLPLGLTPLESDEEGIVVVVPASGAASFGTDGLGPPVSGSVTVRSDQPLAGSVVFGGSFGLAGVDASPAVTTAALIPIEMDSTTGTSTGIALQNLEDSATGFKATLLDQSGNVVANATSITLLAHGHRALFPEQFDWDTPPDFSSFRGVLRVYTVSGEFAVTVLLVKPGQFASLPAGVALLE